MVVISAKQEGGEWDPKDKPRGHWLYINLYDV